MDWIDFGHGDLFEDICDSSNVTKKSKRLCRRPNGRTLERQLRRVSASGNVARLEELLSVGCEGGSEWPAKALRGALKHAANAATVAAIARARPDFFHSPEGAPAALYLAVKCNKETTVRMLLEAGTPIDGCPEFLSSGLHLVHVASLCNSHECLKALIDSGASVNAVSSGLTPLHVAANMGHEETVKVLLEAGGDVGALDNNGWTPLHHGAGTGRYSTLIPLLDAGADVNHMGSEKTSALHMAAKGNSSMYLPSGFQGCWNYEYDFAKCCEILVERGADVHSVDEENKTPMQLAIINCHGRVLGSLVGAGANVFECSEEGETALHTAAGSGGPDAEPIIDLLVEKGLNVNVLGNDHSTPLLRAVYGWQTEAIKALMRHGADTTIANSSGQKPLHAAAANGYLEGVQTMLQAGVDVNMCGDEGQTPLHEGASSSSEIIKELTTAGANIEARTNDGRTPFHYSVRGWNTDCLDTLAELGADLQARDPRGWTAMHFATSESAVEPMRWLLKRSASDPSLTEVLGVGARATDGTTPLHLAAKRGDFMTATWLLRQGASSTAVDKEGRTALHGAARGTCAETMRVLLEGARGCDRVRTLRDVNGDTAAQLAHVAELRRMLDRWCLAA